MAENNFFDRNLICEECLIKKCTVVTLNLDKKLCDDCSNELGVETISASILKNLMPAEQLENYKNQASFYDVLSDLLDNKLSQYDVALDVLDTLYEERCSWIEEYYKENQDLLDIFQHEFSKDRDEMLTSLKNQLTSDEIDPYSLEMAAYNNSQNILGASVISSIHEKFMETVNYVSSTMRVEWSSPYDLFSPHKIQFISTRTREMINIDTLSEFCDKITIEKWNPGKGASWCKLASDAIFYCGGSEKWLLGESLRKSSCILFPPHSDRLCWEKQFDMINKRANHSVVAFNDYLYVIGGYSNSSGFDTIERFNLNKQRWEDVFTSIEVLGSASTCKIGDGILIAGELVPDIYFFDPEKEVVNRVALIAGKKILLKSNDAVYCLADKSLYKSDFNAFNFRMVKENLNCKGNWWMPSQEVLVGTKIFFISEDGGVGELWDLDVSSSDYMLTKHDIKLNN